MAVAAEQVIPLTHAAAPPKRRSMWGRMSRSGIAALALLSILVLAAILGPRLWGQDPLAQNNLVRLTNPTLMHPLGTDKYGRDIFSRLLTGARWSLTGAAIVCLCTSAIGFLIGAFAAMSSRRVDSVIGRLIESLLALPGIVMALALTAVLGSSFPNLLFALVVTSWPSYARIYRALILKEREAGYVESTRSLGASQSRIVFRHMIPNVIGPAAVLATANFGGVILGLASLSFLGLGMQPPTPEWGVMINEARAYFQTYPWQMIAPGACIALTVFAINLTGDSLRDLLDPRTLHR